MRETPPTISKQDALPIIERQLANGRCLHSIAKQLGTNKRTLQLWLADLPDNEQQGLARVSIDSNLLDAQDALESAAKAIEDMQDPESEEERRAASFRLARIQAVARIAESRLRSAQWLAERRDKRYAAKQEVSGAAGITVIVQRGGCDGASVIIEGETVAAQRIGSE